MQYHNIYDYDFLLEFNSDGTKLNIKYNNDGKYIKLFSKKDFIDKCINFKFKSSTKNIINTFIINGYSFFEDYDKISNLEDIKSFNKYKKLKLLKEII
jgi:hypothetical protein